MSQFPPSITQSSTSLWPDTSLALTGYGSDGVRRNSIQDDFFSSFHSVSGTDPDELTRQMAALSERGAKITAWSILYSNSEPTATAR